MQRSPFEHTFTVEDVTTRIELLMKEQDKSCEQINSAMLVVRTEKDKTFQLYFSIELHKEVKWRFIK